MNKEKTTRLPQIVEVRNNQAVTTSLQIAEFFGKLHKDVLRDIRNLECSPDFQERNFALSFYISKLPNNGHKKLPMYYMTRDGFTFLAMGFTGKEASRFKEAYINAFNTMEKVLLEIQTRGLVSASQFEEQVELTQHWQQVASNNAASIKPKEFYLLTDAYYNQIIETVAKWIECENEGSYSNACRDQHLITRLEAIRLLHVDYSRNARKPFNVMMQPAHFKSTN